MAHPQVAVTTSSRVLRLLSPHHGASSGCCHHSMVRPQVADGGTAINVESSCEYIE